MTLYKVEVGSAMYKEGIRWTEGMDHSRADMTYMVGLGDINLDIINMNWMTWPSCVLETLILRLRALQCFPDQKLSSTIFHCWLFVCPSCIGDISTYLHYLIF